VSIEPVLNAVSRRLSSKPLVRRG